MTCKTLSLTAICLLPFGLSAQISFSKKTDLLTPEKHYSGVAIGVVDMNGDGRDDIVRMNQGFQLAIEYQTGPGQSFLHKSLPTLQAGSQWGMCVADVDNNGRPDVLAGGYYDGIKVVLADSAGSAYSLVTIIEPETFSQTVNFIDINNDGWLDAFICHDDAEARIFINDSTGMLVYTPQAINLSTLPPTDNSGNYGSVWSDVNNDGYPDLYIAKCRTGINSPSDGRRINQLFLNNGDGTYTQDTTNASGLRIGAQSWTADFGDIDNDGDFDCFVTNHDVSSQLLENDGAGHFTDISSSAGLFNTITSLPIQGVFRDFDNDGYVDLLVSGTGHYLFRNNGDKTFTSVPILGNTPLESFALGDLNNDGFQDIYAGYAELYSEPSNVPDALWLNNGNDNHYFGLNLRGVASNRSAVGTKVFLHSALGAQVREVRSGESYGIMNSMQVHFGMGQFTQIDSVVIQWPSGAVERLLAPAVDQYLTVEEGRCVLPPVLALPASSPVFCSGDSVSIAVANPFVSYIWSTGSTDTQIIAREAGQYSVTVTTAEGCTAVSNVVTVVVDPVETPTINAQGDTTFCTGGSVILTASPAAAYSWNTGETSASITVSEPGNYTVITQGLCANFVSVPMQVTVLDAPLPVPTPDTVAVGSTGILFATGDELHWYDAPAGGTLLFTGNPFETSPLQESATFWVANNALYDQPNQFTGMPNHLGTNYASNQTNGKLIFDCYAPVRLARVKVYSGKAGMRTIELRTASDSILQSIQVNIPLGTSVVDLNLDIPAGTGLILTTNPMINQQTLGTISPQLRRSDVSVKYPYEIPGYLSIYNSDLGPQRYYYFYNWEIDFPARECLSDRVPVEVFVDSTLVKTTTTPVARDLLRLYPNPSTGSVWLDWQAFAGGSLEVVLHDAQGLSVQKQQLEFPAGPLQVPLRFGELSPGIFWLELRTAACVAWLKLQIIR